MQKNSAFFLDRDGVIIKDIPYLSSIEKIEFLPHTVEAIKLINTSGHKCIVITNQSGVARGLVSLKKVLEIHDHIKDQLSKKEAIIDDFYFCPHHPQGKIKKYSITCKCRKPGIELFLKAAKDYNLELSNTVMIGDKESDLKAGQKVGCQSFMLNTPINFEGNTVNWNLFDLITHILKNELNTKKF